MDEQVTQVGPVVVCKAKNQEVYCICEVCDHPDDYSGTWPVKSTAVAAAKRHAEKEHGWTPPKSASKQ